MWTDFFRSRYVRLIEKELADLRASQSREIEEIRKRFNDAFESLKTVHAQELERAISEANRGWAEADRLRQYLIPGLPAANRVTETSDKEPPAKLDDVETGPPWARILKREMKKQDLEAAAEEAARRAQSSKPAQPAEEKQNAPSN